MPWYARAHVRPMLGSAALHLLFVAIILIAAMNWRSPPPPPPLAIEGNVVRYEDLPRSVRSGRAMKEPVPAPVVPVPREPPAAKPIPEPRPQPDQSAVEAAVKPAAVLEQQQAEQKKATQALAAKQLAAAEAKAGASAAAEARAAAEAQRKADTEAKQHAAAEARSQSKADEAAQQEQQKAAAARAAKQKAESEAELRRALAMEEEGEAVAQSGVVDEYRALLVQTIERNWRRPDSAKAGLACTLFVTQAPGGVVIEVKLGDCNGDQVVRESVADAVYRASPLPAPRDPRAFERRLVIVFKPTE